jgi:phage shock protein A
VVDAERGAQVAEARDLQSDLDALKEAFADLQEENSALSEQVSDLGRKNKQLSEAARSADVAAYARSKTSAQTNSQELMSLLEGADSKAKVDRVVDQFGASSVSDSALETLRQRVRRGNLRQDSAVIEESASASPSSALDVSFSEIKALAGLN